MTHLGIIQGMKKVETKIAHTTSTVHNCSYKITGESCTVLMTETKGNVFIKIERKTFEK